MLQYVLTLQTLQASQSWLMQNVTANGSILFTSIESDGRENQELSQRVEFRVRTNADEQIHRILEVSQ